MKKEKKTIPFGSHEYSLPTLILFFLLAFIGGQFIGAFPAMIFFRSAPLFSAGGYFESISETCILLAIFFINFIIILWLLRALLKTNLRQIISCGRPWKKDFITGCIIIFLVMVVGFSLLFKSGTITYNPAEPKLRFFAFLIALLFVPFQTTVEEIIFRCVLGRFFFRNRLPAPIWKIFLVSILSGVLFFLPHLFNAEVTAYGYATAVAQYFFSGFSLMAIDLLVGSFEPSVVLHAVNNLCVSILFCAEVSTLSFPALFVDHSSTMVLDNISVVAMYIILIGWAFVYRQRHMTDDDNSAENSNLPELS